MHAVGLAADVEDGLHSVVTLDLVAVTDGLGGVDDGRGNVEAGIDEVEAAQRLLVLIARALGAGDLHSFISVLHCIE